FPILDEATLTTYGRVNGVLLDTESRLGSHLLVLNAHLSCCAYDSARQAQSDQFIAGLRDIHEGQGPINPPPGTPFVLVGDLNLVGDRRQLVTLTTGDIVDEASYGRDFAPDLDYTHLADLFSRHTHIRMGYTWRSDGSWFSPGKLDYIIYTDSRLKVDNHYVLNTLAIPSDELAALDLDSLDTHSASDHLPRVVDFSLITLGIDQPRQSSAPAGHALVSAYPNPFNPGTIIVVGNLPANPAQVLIYDIKGRLVRTLTGLQPVGGLAEVYWDGTDSRGRSLAAGVYLIKVASGYISGFGKVVLL
ncbi:MAG: T9SS type A sorting domain-containing protein, partial [Candidatus Marinimicrobia bacterium]|nr:T9SS type A sorting domain-containing protein [Candidatus Neomarinimicrobiota bacterium]